MQAGQNIGVEYYEPDGDTVFNVFHAPSPNLQVQINPQGNPGDGGNLELQVQYVNGGEIDSNNVVITQTLQGMQYLGNTSAFGIITGTTPGGDPYVVYQLGTLPPGNWMQFDVFTRVTVPAPQTITSTVQIAGTPDGGNPGDKERSWSGQVQANNTQVNLGKGAQTGDPVAGGQFVWWVNACSFGSTSSSAIIITDTLPVSTTLISWWGQHAGWTQVSWDTSQLVVTRPSLPNGWCSQVFMRFQVDPKVPVNTNIQNTARVWAAKDINPNDNQASNWVTINNPHTNISISQWWGQGSLVPGGTFQYSMNYYNNGNVPVDGVLITDTLPISVTLNSIRQYDQSWNYIGDVTPTYINGNQIVWEVGRVENGDGGNFNISFTTDPDALPGITLVNTAEISRLAGEDTYSDNTSTWTETLFSHGPNLRITKRSWWNGDGQLDYQIDFANVGDQAVSSVWITDDLPANTQWDGWWNMGFDWNRLVSQNLTSDQLVWKFSSINPGDGGWLQFNANLDDPNARPRWYTNTAEISPYPEDTNPADNIATTSNVLGEVEDVSLWVSPGSYGIWGNAQPGATVTVTTATKQFTALADPGCNGCWSINNPPQFVPGETITVTAGSGLLPVMITVPDPFIVHADFNTDTVSGQVGNLSQQTLRVELYGYSGVNLQTDENGIFVARFSDITPAGNGHVRYDTTIDYAPVYFHYRFQADDLLLWINYAHDWLQTVYPVGHTVSITVTNNLGVQKATTQGVTVVNGAWEGKDGFQTSTWLPNQPDIQEGDWVYARTDDGKTAQVHIGVIKGELDLLADSVSGTITAPFTTTLRTVCQVWVGGAPAPIVGSVDPVGGSYTCSWAGKFDIQPDMWVGVSYLEPGNHQVFNAFLVGKPNLYINKWGDGQPGEGGNYTFHINYVNQGNGPADGVVITDTLPVGMSYLSDTAPFTRTGSNPLVWDLGSLQAGSNATFDLYVQVDAPASTTLTNTAQIDTSNPWDTAPPENKISQWAVTVQPNNTQLSIGMWSHTGNPVPGYQYIYEISVCNSGSTGSAEVTLTETLPVSLTLVSWWGNSFGWTEINHSDHQLILKPAVHPIQPMP